MLEEINLDNVSNLLTEPTMGSTLHVSAIICKIGRVSSIALNDKTLHSIIFFMESNYTLVTFVSLKSTVEVLGEVLGSTIIFFSSLDTYSVTLTSSLSTFSSLFSLLFSFLFSISYDCVCSCSFSISVSISTFC